MALTADRLATVARVTQRLANYSVFAVGSAELQAAMKTAIDIDLATLGTIGADAGINAIQLAKQVAFAAIQDAINIGLQALLGLAIP